MAKFGVRQTSEIEPTWHAYIDVGDGDPVKFLVSALTEVAQNRIDKLLEDSDYIKSLNIDWKRLPKIEGISKKVATRRVLFADYILRDWTDNVVGEDETVTLPCDIYGKSWLLQVQPFNTWIVERAQEGGGKVIVEEVKNSETLPGGITPQPSLVSASSGTTEET
jgi:hypothetical protein